jgi:hypothetical protein
MRTVVLLLAMTTGAQAYTTRCQRHGGPAYACHVCFHGSNWMTLSEYECSAKAERRQERDREFQQCYRDLTLLPDGPFKRKCLRISEITP